VTTDHVRRSRHPARVACQGRSESYSWTRPSSNLSSHLHRLSAWTSFRLSAYAGGTGGKKLGDITSHDIEDNRLHRTRAVGPRTIDVEMKIFRIILRKAKLWNRLADDYKLLPENKRGPGRALSPEEEKLLFDLASSNPDGEVAVAIRRS